MQKFARHFLTGYSAAATDGYRTKLTSYGRRSCHGRRSTKIFDTGVTWRRWRIHEGGQHGTHVISWVRPALGIILWARKRLCTHPGYVTTRFAFAMVTRKSQAARIGRINDIYFMETMSFGLDLQLLQPHHKHRANNSSTEGEGSLLNTRASSLYGCR